MSMCKTTKNMAVFFYNEELDIISTSVLQHIKRCLQGHSIDDIPIEIDLTPYILDSSGSSDKAIKNLNLLGFHRFKSTRYVVLNPNEKSSIFSVSLNMPNDTSQLDGYREVKVNHFRQLNKMDEIAKLNNPYGDAPSNLFMNLIFNNEVAFSVQACGNGSLSNLGNDRITFAEKVGIRQDNPDIPDRKFEGYGWVINHKFDKDGFYTAKAQYCGRSFTTCVQSEIWMITEAGSAKLLSLI